MIIVRFFTGVEIQYARGTQIIFKPDGRVEIKTGDHPENGEVLAVLQATAGAVIQNGETGQMTIPGQPPPKPPR